MSAEQIAHGLSVRSDVGFPQSTATSGAQIRSFQGVIFQNAPNFLGQC